MIFPMVSSVNGFPASGLHAALLKQPGQRRVHPAHPDGSPEPWAVRDVAPQHLHVVAHQRPLPPLSRRSPLSATRSITSVRVSSLECLIALISPSPPPDFAHKPAPVFPVEGDPPVPNPSLCLHVLRSSECVDIYDTGLSAGRAEAAEALKSPGQSARPDSEAPVVRSGRREAPVTRREAPVMHGERLSRHEAS